MELAILGLLAVLVLVEAAALFFFLDRTKVAAVEEEVKAKLTSLEAQLNAAVAKFETAAKSDEAAVVAKAEELFKKAAPVAANVETAVKVAEGQAQTVVTNVEAAAKVAETQAKAVETAVAPVVAEVEKKV